jgi:hypothetical protein
VYAEYRFVTHRHEMSVKSRVFAISFQPHSIDYHEQGIIGKLVAVPSISNDSTALRFFLLRLP